MKARGFIVMAALAGCGQPEPLPCTGVGVGVCSADGLCIDGFCADSDPTCGTGYRFDESAGSLAGTCADPGGSGSGNGNGDAGGGETLSDPVIQLLESDLHKVVDATHAVNDIDTPCAAAGGVDVMFQIDVPSDFTRLYIDTDNTTFDSVLAVYAGTCQTAPTKQPMDCISNTHVWSCSAQTKRWSRNLAPGTHCIVIDQAIQNPTHAIASLNLMLGPPAVDAIVGTTVASTCGHDEWTPNPALCTAPDGPDATWFFMACSGNYRAKTQSSWPGDLETGTSVNPSMDCNTGAAGVYYDATKPAPMWIIAHQAAGACGQVSLTIAPY